MNDWEEFIKSCENRQNNFKYSKLSENGKKLLDKIKISIKNNENIIEKIDKNFSLNLTITSLEKNKTLGIDRKTDKLLCQGKYPIDYTIDLHGFTIEEAYLKIKAIFEKAIQNNYRCILIITGKGLHSQNTTIKSSLTQWLKEPFFASKIIKWTDATQKDGGSGAVYVLLKKTNKINF